MCNHHRIEYTKTLKSETAIDEEMMSLGGPPDGTGDYLDIHETLFDSKMEGVYLRRKIRQALILAYMEDTETRGVRLSSNRKERPLPHGLQADETGAGHAVRHRCLHSDKEWYPAGGP